MAVGDPTNFKPKCHCGCNAYLDQLPQIKEAITIESGKTYVVELEQPVTREQIKMMYEMWKKQTGSKVIFLDRAKIARNGVDETALREKIANEILALCCDPLTCKDYRASAVECAHTNAKWERAASIARGKYA